ncbi:hypothetical protein FRC19_005590 [Serendipita sp. 401]|nr:hypothetical protein FRC19_005590 [Serendipita sp. 401]KAG9026581.1 hypothetical protein FS842_005044 [Serendipita sp. 407]
MSRNEEDEIARLIERSQSRSKRGREEELGSTKEDRVKCLRRQEGSVSLSHLTDTRSERSGHQSIGSISSLVPPDTDMASDVADSMDTTPKRAQGTIVLFCALSAQSGGAQSAAQVKELINNLACDRCHQKGIDCVPKSATHCENCLKQKKGPCTFDGPMVSSDSAIVMVKQEGKAKKGGKMKKKPSVLVKEGGSAKEKGKGKEGAQSPTKVTVDLTSSAPEVAEVGKSGSSGRVIWQGLSPVFNPHCQLHMGDSDVSSFFKDLAHLVNEGTSDCLQAIQDHLNTISRGVHISSDIVADIVKPYETRMDKVMEQVEMNFVQVGTRMSTFECKLFEVRTDLAKLNQKINAIL